MDGLTIETRKPAASRPTTSSRLVRDLIADWKRWNAIERIIAGALLATLPTVAPVVYIGLALSTAS